MNKQLIFPTSNSSIEEIVADLKAGKMVIITDDEKRENEGDLLMAAEYVTPEAINFMATYGRGLICLSLTSERCDYLGLTPMASKNNSRFSTAFTVSIEAKDGISTGISAADRARTVKVAVAAKTTEADIVQPGHIFPLRAINGGVLVRAGHTEAGIDLTKLAGLTPAAVICEIMNPDGTMARMPQLHAFAAQHNLKIATIADLIAYRSRTEKFIELVGEKNLLTPWGDFLAKLYKDKLTNNLHLALLHGHWNASDVVPIRVHETQSSLDFLDSQNTTNTNWSLPSALTYIKQQPCGLAVILGGSQNTAAVIDSFNNHNSKATFDDRRHGIGAQIIKDCLVHKMKVIGSVRKLPNLTEGYGLEITEYIGQETTN